MVPFDRLEAGQADADCIGRRLLESHLRDVLTTAVYKASAARRFDE